MSFIVTSNVSIDDRPETSNIFKPFSYSNRLLNTMKVPKNSQIAVESCKINKSGMLVVDRSNSQFNINFGVELGEDIAASPDLSYSTTQPFFGVCGSGNALADGRRIERNPEDFATDIQIGVVQALKHPAFVVNDATAATVDVDPIIAAGAFEGYTITATADKGALTSKVAGSTFATVAKGATEEFTAIGQEVTSTTQNGFWVQAQDYPIAQNGGEVVFDIEDANVDRARSPFSVGLSRINDERRILGAQNYYPGYFHPGPRQQKANAVWYQDICVQRINDLLYVFQSGVDGNTGRTVMNEIEYYGAHNANFAAILDIRAARAVYTSVKFKLDGEEISIYLLEGGKPDKLLVDFTTLEAAGGTKNEVTNPINCAEWAMYPTFGCSLNAVAGVPGDKSITLTSVSHYANYPLFDKARYAEWDWWGSIQERGTLRWALEVESRFWNNSADVTGGEGGDGLLAPKNMLTGGDAGAIDGYKLTIITTQSRLYGSQMTSGANTSNTLGFARLFGASSVVAANEYKITSVTVPSLDSNASLFIRLNNFTQQSTNARQGTTSKILAHLPRFDNAGNETGGLFYQPHERVYVDLKNAEAFDINSFDVDICYDNETICHALSGKTVVCFHLRNK